MRLFNKNRLKRFCLVSWNISFSIIVSIKSFLRGMKIIKSGSCFLLLMTVMASGPTMPLHHLLETSGLESMAVLEGTCYSLLDGCYDANSIYEWLWSCFWYCVLNHSHYDGVPRLSLCWGWLTVNWDIKRNKSVVFLYTGNSHNASDPAKLSKVFVL